MGRDPLKKIFHGCQKFCRAVLALKAKVRHLHGYKSLGFRDIARRLLLSGPDRAHSLYPRARRRAGRQNRTTPLGPGHFSPTSVAP
jgi:hypothetical protein